MQQLCLPNQGGEECDEGVWNAESTEGGEVWHGLLRCASYACACTGELERESAVLRFSLLDNPDGLKLGFFHIFNHPDGTYSGKWQALLLISPRRQPRSIPSVNSG